MPSRYPPTANSARPLIRVGRHGRPYFNRLRHDPPGERVRPVCRGRSVPAVELSAGRFRVRTDCVGSFTVAYLPSRRPFRSRLKTTSDYVVLLSDDRNGPEHTSVGSPLAFNFPLNTRSCCRRPYLIFGPVVRRDRLSPATLRGCRKTRWSDRLRYRAGDAMPTFEPIAIGTLQTCECRKLCDLFSTLWDQGPVFSARISQSWYPPNHTGAS